jgi:anti-anti-sigma factor
MPASELRRDVPTVGIAEDRVGSAIVLRLEGRLTVESDTHRLEDVLALVSQSDVRHVVLDLTHLEQIDCSGIGWLVRLRNEACRWGNTFALVSVNRFQKRVLELLGLLGVLRVFGSRQDALGACRSSAVLSDGRSFAPLGPTASAACRLH